tara:strand:- start:932 stop:1225 length:294 start_codon:yes stop_codon:yes gene_type:complete
MAAKTRIKIYTPKNEFIASCKYFEDASILSLAGGPGMTVRMGHAKRDTIWTEPDHDNDADRDTQFWSTIDAWSEGVKKQILEWENEGVYAKANNEGN